MSLMIEASGLSKKLGKQVVLEDVSFDIGAGEIVALTGSNGAGKTTTLNILLGLYRADRGRASVLGHPAATRRHLGSVGWMPESPAFPASCRVADLIRFQARSFGSWDQSFADELVERLEIPIRARPRELSRGQRARAALLLAFAHRPELLLLDDPTLGLDPEGRQALARELVSLVAESGSTVLMTTHLVGEFENIIDRLMVLRSSRIVVDEPVESLRSRWRRIECPPALIPGLPPSLDTIENENAILARRWDSSTWSEYQSGVPVAATALPVDLETIYLASGGNGR